MFIVYSISDFETKPHKHFTFTNKEDAETYIAMRNSPWYVRYYIEEVSSN